MSSTSRMGNDPNPLGNDFNLFIPKFKILNLLIPDKDVGTSFKELLKRFKISIFSKFAMAGGNSDILLWLKVSLQGVKRSLCKLSHLLEPIDVWLFSPKFCQCYLLGVPYLLLSLLIVNLDFFCMKKLMKQRVQVNA